MTAALVLLSVFQPPAHVAGEWALTIVDPLQRSYAVTLNLDQDGTAITGVAVDEAAETIEELTGSIDGSRILMSYSADAPGRGRIRLAFEGQVTDGEMAGNVTFGRLARPATKPGASVDRNGCRRPADRRAHRPARREHPRVLAAKSPQLRVGRSGNRLYSEGRAGGAARARQTW